MPCSVGRRRLCRRHGDARAIRHGNGPREPHALAEPAPPERARDGPTLTSATRPPPERSRRCRTLTGAARRRTHWRSQRHTKGQGAVGPGRQRRPPTSATRRAGCSGRVRPLGVARTGGASGTRERKALSDLASAARPPTSPGQGAAGPSPVPPAVARTGRASATRKGNALWDATSATRRYSSASSRCPEGPGKAGSGTAAGASSTQPIRFFAGSGRTIRSTVTGPSRNGRRSPTRHSSGR